MAVQSDGEKCVQHPTNHICNCVDLRPLLMCLTVMKLIELDHLDVKEGREEFPEGNCIQGPERVQYALYVRKSTIIPKETQRLDFGLAALSRSN